MSRSSVARCIEASFGTRNSSACSNREVSLEADILTVSAGLAPAAEDIAGMLPPGDLVSAVVVDLGASRCSPWSAVDRDLGLAEPLFGLFFKSWMSSVILDTCAGVGSLRLETSSWRASTTGWSSSNNDGERLTVPRFRSEKTLSSA